MLRWWGALTSLTLFSGLVLVTDAITAMGLPPGRHTLGQQVIEIQGLHAYVAGLSFFQCLNRLTNESGMKPGMTQSWMRDMDMWSECSVIFPPSVSGLIDKTFEFWIYISVFWTLHSVSLLGTKTLSGSIATMDMCVRHFRHASGQFVWFDFFVAITIDPVTTINNTINSVKA